MTEPMYEHIENEYSIVISNNKEHNICVLDLPRNVFLDLPKATTIYELENGKVSVYRNKQKFLERSCPNYARRTVVWAHMLRLMEDRNLLKVPITIKPYNHESIHLPIEMDTARQAIFKMLEEPDLHQDVELELKLVQTIESISKNRTNTIPDEISEGFMVGLHTFKGE